jgi:serine/threonine protein kinase
LGALPEDICRYYFKKIIDVVNYIHLNGFAHRNLRPENILLDQDFDLKLVSFGLAAPLIGYEPSD